MFKEREDNPGMAADLSFYFNKKTLIPALVCAGLSVFFINGGLLSLFFLAPLGYAALVYNSYWISFFIAVGINIFFTTVIRHGSSLVLMDTLYLAVLALCFAWIMLGGSARIRTLYRFIVSASVVSVFLMFFVFGGSKESAFNMMVNSQSEILSSFFPSITPEALKELMLNVALKGGIITSAFFLFFVNRHAAFAAMRIIRKKNQENSLSAFFAPENTIWVFSCSLMAVILTGILKIQILDVIAWNALIVCCLIFLVQGAGIVLFFLARRTPGFRLAVNLLVIFLIFSPLGTVAAAGLLLLGVAENWFHFRAPSSTPG